MMEDKMMIEKFGDAIDVFMKAIDAQMLIESPKGTLDVQVQDVTGIGAVLQFYILMNAVRAVAASMRDDLKIDGKSKEWAKSVDSLLELVRKELLEVES